MRLRNFVCNAFRAYPGPAFLVVIVLVVLAALCYARHQDQGAQSAPPVPTVQEVDGVPVTTTGGAFVPQVTQVMVPTVDGGSHYGLRIDPVEAWVGRGPHGPDRTRCVVSFPLPQDVKGISFNIRQPKLTGDITRYAHATLLEVQTGTGAVVRRVEINKQNLLTAPVPVELAGARQVNIVLGTQGKSEDGGSWRVTDQYGPWFPLLITDLKFTRH